MNNIHHVHGKMSYLHENLFFFSQYENVFPCNFPCCSMLFHAIPCYYFISWKKSIMSMEKKSRFHGKKSMEQQFIMLYDVFHGILAISMEFHDISMEIIGCPWKIYRRESTSIVADTLIQQINFILVELYSINCMLYI